MSTVKAGSYNTFEANIVAGKKFGNFEISAFFDYLTTEGPKPKIEIDVLSSDPSGISLAGTDKGYTKLFRNKLTSTFNMDYKGFYSKSLFVGAKKGDYIGATSAITENSEAKHFQVQQMLGYKHKFSDKLSLDINVVYLLYYVDNLLNLYPPGFVGVGIYTQGMYQEMGGKQQTTSANIQIDYNLFTNNTLQVGISYDYIKYFDEINKGNPPGTDIDDLVDLPSFFEQDVLVRELFSAYAQDNWNIFKTLSLTAGVRLDNYSDVGLTVNPRVALVFNPTEKLNLKLLYGNAFRAPTFVEIYFNGAPYLAGDKDIKPETIKTYEVYLGYRINKWISTSVNYFNNLITNLITILPDSDLSVETWETLCKDCNVGGNK